MFQQVGDVRPRGAKHAGFLMCRFMLTTSNVGGVAIDVRAASRGVLPVGVNNPVRSEGQIDLGRKTVPVA